MYVFVCYTPLHILLAAITLQQMEKTAGIVFIIIEESTGLSRFARSFLKSEYRIISLPGRANVANRMSRTIVQRTNMFRIRSIINSLPCTCFIFNDMLPESQALLNMNAATNNGIEFIMVEDGVALYAPRGVVANRAIDRFLHKLAFGLEWRHSSTFGHHDNLSEIWCLYPEALCDDLKAKPCKPLGRQVPQWVHDFAEQSFSHMPEEATIIALPYIGHSIDILDRYLTRAVEFARRYKSEILFKSHPLDGHNTEILKKYVENPIVIPNTLPIELLMMRPGGKYNFIGSRTSALHVTNALAPDVRCYYFENGSDPVADNWIAFFTQLGIPGI